MKRLLLAACVLLTLPMAAPAATILVDDFETSSAGGPGTQNTSKALPSPGTPTEHRFGELNNGGLADSSRDFTLPGWTVHSEMAISATGLNSKAYIQRDNDGGTGALADMPNDPNGDLWLMLDARGANTAADTGVGVYSSPDVIAANTLYSLGVTVGKRGAVGLPPEFQFGLWAGTGSTPDAAISGSILDHTAFDNPVASGTGGGVVQSFLINLDTSLPSNQALVGQNLFVRFLIPGSAGGGAALQVMFNDVSLDATPVPEPGAFAVLVLGSVGLVATRKMRQRFSE